MKHRRRLLRLALPVSIFLSQLALSQTIWALDGMNAPELSVHNGWQAFEIVTQQDDITTIAESGYGNTATWGKNDGIGAYRDSADNVFVTLNHESTPAAISGVSLDYGSFRQAIQSTIDDGATPFPLAFVQQMGFAYQAIFDGSYHATKNAAPVASGTAQVMAYGAANFSRFCSGTTHRANTFGLNRGFVDPIYLTGEEVSGGKFYALDLTTENLWEVSDLGLGVWENAAQLDPGNETHTALLLSSDVSSSPGDYLRLYVGARNVDANADGQIDFLERNGLRGGTTYYFTPNAGASTSDLPDGTVNGRWQTSTVGALRETKLEDVDTNPHNGSQVALGVQRDGVYVLESELLFANGSLDTTATSVSITQIDDDDDAPIGAPDNLSWSRNGLLYVQEDGDGDGMFELSPGDGIVSQIATGHSEPSGIVDISEQMGFTSGSVLLTSIQGTGTTGAQLSVLIAPDAAAVRLGDFDGDGNYACQDVDSLVAAILAQSHDPVFDVTGDGLVDETDLDAWLLEAGAENLASGASYLRGDANLDGDVDGADFLIWNQHKFTTTAAWCSGDFNANGFVDGVDFLVWNDNKFQSADRFVSVPCHISPWSFVMAGLCSLVLFLRQY